MSKKNIGLGIVCLLVVVLAGMVGAQVIQGAPRRYLNTGLFSLTATETAHVYISLDDNPGGPAARVVLQLLDEAGNVVAHDEANLQAGQSMRLVSPGPGLFRAHAEVTETTTLPLSPRRTAVGSAEAIDSITGRRRQLPSFDPVPIPARP